MFYRALGWAVWNGGKLFLRQRYGRAYVPKPLIAGAVVAVVGGVALLVTRHGSDA
jgi:hypothetical protein